MNKKGFTLIELIVSIILVSIVLVSMTGTLVKLKDTYSLVYEDADARIYGATISKVINDDLLTSNGIKTIDCSDDGKVNICEIVMGNNEKRTLEILRNETNKDTETITSNGDEIGTKKYEKTTLRYSDSTTGDVKTILIKTIEQVIRTNNQGGSNRVTTTGYKFTTLSQESFKYENVNDSTKVDKMTHITIGLSDENYNIDLYSSGTYNK